MFGRNGEDAPAPAAAADAGTVGAGAGQPLLTREALLSGAHLARRTVEVPGLGCVVVTELTVAERLAVHEALDAQEPVPEDTPEPAEGEAVQEHGPRTGSGHWALIAAFLVQTLRDGEGRRLLGDGDEPRLLRALTQRDLLVLWDAAAELNGLTLEDQDERVGNSAAAPSAAPG